MKKDFYIYKCLMEIHRLNQKALLEENNDEILLILNTPGSLEHCMVHTDPGRLKRVFDRILNHVVKFLNRGSVEFGYKLGTEGQLSFYVWEPSGSIMDQPLLESKFNQEAELLADINTILSPLDGRIWIDNHQDTGRIFWFSVNIQPPEKPDAGKTDNTESISYPDWSKKTILVVDDVSTNLLLLENFLHPTGASIISVDNGLKAVNAVKKHPTIEFVLMDVRMPVLDGYEATRRIKRIRPWLPVIAISAYPGSAESAKWKQAGCDSFLGKPLNSSELIRSMRLLFEQAPIAAQEGRDNYFLNSK